MTKRYSKNRILFLLTNNQEKEALKTNPCYPTRLQVKKELLEIDRHDIIKFLQDHEWLPECRNIQLDSTKLRKARVLSTTVLQVNLAPYLKDYPGFKQVAIDCNGHVKVDIAYHSDHMVLQPHYVYETQEQKK